MMRSINLQPIYQNFPGCNAYTDDSFTGILHEKCYWSDAEYFKLDNALYALAQAYKDESQCPRELVGCLMRIFSFVIMSINCHYDPNDLYQIENLDNEQLRIRKERFQQVFEGVFLNNMLPVNYFEYQCSTEK
ncbi:Imm41 family immunity protein [Celerinatantimonas sp. YJH-8]|uniref:Imm41 family immunity protein n=1 Tax=Celerinatantimonas sp. YJH-8 TaxID=3228714 RepID=UPI0038C6B902